MINLKKTGRGFEPAPREHRTRAVCSVHHSEQTSRYVNFENQSTGIAPSLSSSLQGSQIVNGFFV